jgi:hypothetical protein
VNYSDVNNFEAEIFSFILQCKNHGPVVLRANSTIRHIVIFRSVANFNPVAM